MTDKNTATLANNPENHLDMVGRWYMVNKMGMATLCNDRTDAEKEAADAQSVWPHMGPHRAVQLAPAGDMAKLRGQRMVLCSLLGECLPVIDALMQMPGDDDSDARLNGLADRITGALNALAEERDLNREANARLIAAAPELLEACVAMAEWGDAHGEIVFVGGGWGAVNQMNNAMLLSRAAIAKATGNDG